MTRVMTLALAALLVAGCGKKGTTPDAAADAAKNTVASEVTAKMPEGKDAAAYAKRLVATTVNNWEPMANSGGVKFQYDELTFAPTGTWNANATLEADFEEIPCSESGSWEIQEVENDTTATMLWTVTKTNCAMRNAGTEIRVQMLLPGTNKWTINFR